MTKPCMTKRMKTKRNTYCSRAAALLAAAWLAAGCSDAPDEPLRAGEEPYRRYCATCHGTDGAGKAPAFPPLAGSEWLALGPDAVALVVLLGLKGEIEVAGRTYRGYMPPMPQISDDELAATLGFLVEAGWADWPDGGPGAGRIAELRARVADRGILEGRTDLESLLDEVSP